MIGYRCAKCKADLEAPSCLAGLTERCPHCASENVVPIQFSCHQCHALMQVGRFQAGQWRKCSRCGAATLAPRSGSGPTNPEAVELGPTEPEAEGQPIREWTGQEASRPFWNRVRSLDDPVQDGDEDDEEDEGVTEEERICTKVRGVTFENPDGSNRQDVIANCHDGDGLCLLREPDNPADPNAVGVFTMNGQMCGHLGAELASDIAPLMDSGLNVTAYVLQVTGGDDGRSFGLNIEVVIEQ